MALLTTFTRERILTAGGEEAFVWGGNETLTGTNATDESVLAGAPRHGTIVHFSWAREGEGGTYQPEIGMAAAWTQDDENHIDDQDTAAAAEIDNTKTRYASSASAEVADGKLYIRWNHVDTPDGVYFKCVIVPGVV